MSADTLTNLTALGESSAVGFKRSFQSNPGAEICVFANTTGGAMPRGTATAGRDGGNEEMSPLAPAAPVSAPEHRYPEMTTATARWAPRIPASASFGRRRLPHHRLAGTGACPSSSA